MLGVHRNTTNLAIHGELGTYPLHIDIKIKMVLYFLYLRDQNNKILSGTLIELQKINNGRGSSCIKKIEQLIVEYNLAIITYKYGSKNENFHHQLLSYNSRRIVLRKNLPTSFLEEWDVKTSSTSKLSFYRQYKQNHKLENYIVLVNNKRHVKVPLQNSGVAHIDLKERLESIEDSIVKKQKDMNNYLGRKEHVIHEKIKWRMSIISY